MNGLYVRPYLPGDENLINQVFCRIFRQNRSLEEWHWKFCRQSLQPYIMLAVDEANQLLAQYAALPVRFQTPLGPVLAGQVVDVFSVPQARIGLAAGKAYLEAMAHFFEQWGRPDVLAILFGFPSHRPLKLGKLTGRYDQIPDQTVLRLRWRPKQRPKLAKSGSKVLWGIAPTLMELLWHEHGPRFAYAGIRDAAYIRWRYMQKPAADYHGVTLFRREQPLGWVIFRSVGASLALVDWAVPPDPAVWRELLGVVERAGLAGDVKEFEAWLAGDQDTVECLKAVGFSCEPHDQVRLAVRLFHPDLDPQLVPGRFYVTWGDSDLI